MKMYCLTNDKHVSNEDPVELTLEQALREVDTFPSLEESHLPEQRAPSLGFVNDDDEVIQFDMREGDSWGLDIPLVDREHGRFVLSLNAWLSTLQVQKLVTTFFEGSSNIDALLRLQRHKRSVDDDIKKKLSWEIWLAARDPSRHVLHADYLLVDQDDRVVCEVRVAEPDPAKSILSGITRDSSLSLVGVQELVSEKKKGEQIDEYEIARHMYEHVRAFAERLRRVGAQADALAKDWPELSEIPSALTRAQVNEPDDLKQFEDTLRPLEDRCLAGISALRDALICVGVSKEELEAFVRSVASPIESTIRTASEVIEYFHRIHGEYWKKDN